MVKIAVKVGKHRLSRNTGHLFGFRVIDGIVSRDKYWKKYVRYIDYAWAGIEGPYYNKSVWQRLKGLIKR